MKVEFYRHSLGDEEKASVLGCLDDVFLTTGNYVKVFEEKFADYFGLKYAVGLTSCTAALHLSLLALNIGAGDEVITTPMTFIATATSIIHSGAIPIFVDVEPETGLLDPLQIEKAITPRTKAIIPVHLYGQMCDMAAIQSIANRHGLFIIEDAAHCIEGERDGIRPGAASDAACFSFYATKNITSGEGGAIVTKNPDLAERSRRLRQHGMSKEAAERYSGAYRHWDMLECGWKYNMDNIHAALLLPQLRKIDHSWERRKALYESYMQALQGVPNIDFPNITDHSISAFHLFTVWVAEDLRDRILDGLGRHGIGAAVNYRAIHLLTYFRKRFGFRKGAFPAAEKIGNSTISLPFYPGMTEKDIRYVAEILGTLCR